MNPLTVEFVMSATGANRTNAERFLPHLQQTCDRYGIDTPNRVAGFLSQIGHESGGLARLEESLNYSVEALLGLFGRHRISEADARKYGRSQGKRANQETLANILYGGAWGRTNLGNTEPGDGWRFRGRGLKQLTGRSNYERCGNAIGEDLLANPDLLLQPAFAAQSAGWFWQANGLNAVADHADVSEMTRRVNGGAIGLAQREALFRTALASPVISARMG